MNKCTSCKLKKGVLIGTYVMYCQQKNYNYEMRLCQKCMFILIRQLLDAVPVSHNNSLLEFHAKKV